MIASSGNCMTPRTRCAFPPPFLAPLSRSPSSSCPFTLRCIALISVFAGASGGGSSSAGGGGDESASPKIDSRNDTSATEDGSSSEKNASSRLRAPSSRVLRLGAADARSPSCFDGDLRADRLTSAGVEGGAVLSRVFGDLREERLDVSAGILAAFFPEAFSLSSCSFFSFASFLRSRLAALLSFPFEALFFIDGFRPTMSRIWFLSASLSPFISSITYRGNPRSSPNPSSDAIFTRSFCWL
mmetsp:Transcript_54490/g.128627  ORF Transcript_54490/g.128627 Transcript_54490/m.128627 type:complete len:242 (-) Transcript_54490:422-1147(-)